MTLQRDTSTAVLDFWEQVIRRVVYDAEKRSWNKAVHPKNESIYMSCPSLLASSNNQSILRAHSNN